MSATTTRVNENGETVRKCSICGNELPLKQFDRSGKYLKTACKECRHKRYVEQQERHSERVCRFRIQLWGRDACASCGATEDLHQHHNQGVKNYEIAAMVDKTDDEVLSEMKLTIPLCGSCHGKIHTIDGIGHQPRTNVDIDKAIELRRKGLSLEDIASELRTSRRTLCNHLKENGIEYSEIQKLAA